jgi:hypothetical protein
MFEENAGFHFVDMDDGWSKQCVLKFKINTLGWYQRFPICPHWDI